MSPIVVDPSYIPPAASDTIGSPDGLLQVRMDTENAGVKLRADVSSLSPAPLAVRFYRGDGTLVRSGDPAFAPGGIAHAYDHEAPIGAPATYYVAAIQSDGTDGVESDRVTVELPLIPDSTDPRRQTWIKGVGRPDLAGQFRISDFTQSDRPVGASVNQVWGASLPVVSRTVLGGLTGSMTIRTDTEADYMLLKRLLDEPNVLLFQPAPDSGEEQMFFIPTKVGGAARLGDHSIGWEARLWQVEFQQSRRPATLDAPLRIPGLSWAAVASHYPTWAELASRVASWDELIWGGLGTVETQYDVLDGGSFDSVPPNVLDMGGF